MTLGTGPDVRNLCLSLSGLLKVYSVHDLDKPFFFFFQCFIPFSFRSTRVFDLPLGYFTFLETISVRRHIVIPSVYIHVVCGAVNT